MSISRLDSPSAVVSASSSLSPVSGSPLRVALVLSGLGRVQRGAEAAFLELARSMAGADGVAVTLFGSGSYAMPDGARARVVECRPRERFERWPRVPTLRGEGSYEELSFVWNLRRSGLYRGDDHDVVVHCTYPWVNWYVRGARGRRGASRPLAVVV